MDFITITDRYRNDPEFHNLVEVMIHHMTAYKIQPYVVRDAAFMAELIFRQTHIQPLMYVTPNSMDWEDLQKMMMGLAMPDKEDTDGN